MTGSGTGTVFTYCLRIFKLYLLWCVVSRNRKHQGLCQTLYLVLFLFQHHCSAVVSSGADYSSADCVGHEKGRSEDLADSCGNGNFVYDWMSGRQLVFYTEDAHEISGMGYVVCAQVYDHAKRPFLRMLLSCFGNAFCRKKDPNAISGGCRFRACFCVSDV